jgi:hypothetical protein
MGRKCQEKWQEWRDSNPQPPVLETGALTKLSYTPARPRIAD